MLCLGSNGSGVRHSRHRFSATKVCSGSMTPSAPAGMSASGAQSGHPKHRLRPVRDALWPAQWIAVVFLRPSGPASATRASGVRTREIRSSSCRQFMDAGAVGDCRCAGWWKAFTIRSNPLELGRRFRYILAVHTTCLVVRKTLILMPFFEDPGEGLRIPPSHPRFQGSALQDS
jgi:hypothetical protein